MTVAAVTRPATWPPRQKSTRESARARFPARAEALNWPATCRSRQEIWTQVTSPPFVLANAGTESKRIRGLTRLLGWLESQPGATWQDRWRSSGAEVAGVAWRQVPLRWLDDHGRRSQWLPAELSAALKVMICADLIRPSLSWLVAAASVKGALAGDLARTRDPDGFARLAARCHGHPGISARARLRALQRISVIIAAKGGSLTDITVGDVLELLDVETEVLAGWPGDGPTLYQILHELDVLGRQAPARLRELRTGGQKTPDELIDRYQLACRPVRDLLVDYLKERQPGLDYNSLRALAYYLGNRFWKDLELHHPDLDSLHLPAEVAAAWRQRLLTQPKTVMTKDGQKSVVSVPRVSYGQCLTSVRSFYLDLSQWAIEDPARWAHWVVPCPVSQDEIGNRKFVRRRKARMDARTRERLPVLPVLVRTVDRRRETAGELLQAARQAEPGDTFTAAGQTLTRSLLAQSATVCATPKIWVDGAPGGKRRDLWHEEEYAFWAWAAVEVLRFTGIRIEELLEIGHHSLVQYRLPTTGELVPLLQIAPSKTDAERLLVVSPELADVLSTIIQRVREPSGAVPLVPAYDWHECVWMPPAPLLFQRRFRTENRSINHGTLRKMLQAALADTGLVDADGGGPLNYTPHDFRRLFITDAIMNGLPPHIAQIIAGHRDINVTLGYKAIYPDEAIRAHLAFLARRRSLRPSEEYRVPTDAEWEEFLGHFERRKVATGLCGRAYSTPCIHENACLRCSMHWPDPAQRTRIVEIRDNLIDRIAEADREGWLGEVEGLNISLAGANDKLAQLDRRSPATATVDLGMPTRQR
ncbi:MAG TPA: site-specific integrase [Trebonia sp.]